MPEKLCPRCGVYNPSNADQCGCGHRFVRKYEPEKKPLSQLELERNYQEEQQRIHAVQQALVEKIVTERKLKRQSRQGKILLLGIFFVFVIVAVLGLTLKKQPIYNASPTKPIKASPSALEMCSTVFVGNPSQAAIKILMDKALTRYGMPITEENYLKLGNVLVEMRKSTPGVNEIAILTCVIGIDPKHNMKLHEVIALCTVTIGLQEK